MASSPRTILDAYPLSPLQQGMLYHWVTSPGTGVDVEQILVELDEPLRLPDFRSAWARVVSRHAVLRTAFEFTSRDEPIQQVYDDVTVPCAVDDWSALTTAEAAARLEQLLAEDRRRGFALDVPPLMRLHVIRRAHDTAVLWSFHHALLDGRSFPLVLREVFDDYDAASTGRASSPPPSRPYRDYIDWLEAQDWSASEAHWRQTLAGVSSPTPLAFLADADAARSGTDSYHEIRQQLSVADTDAIVAFARQQGVTPGTMVQAAWALLLRRYSGEPDVVFGATRACRHSTLEGAADMLGLFINTLPLRVAVNDERPVGDWLRDLRAGWLAMRPYEQTPLPVVRRCSDVPTSQSLFDTLVVFEHQSIDATLKTFGPAWASRKVTYFGQTNFPLTITAYGDRQLDLRLGYYRSRISDEQAAQVLGHLRLLVRALADDPHRRLIDVPWLSAEERQRLITDWNATARAYPRDVCLHALIEAQVERAPEAIAVRFRDDQLTYQALNARANQLARALQRRGVTVGTRVGVAVERSLEMVVALLGVLKAGAAYVPIDPTYPADRLAFMIEDAAVPVLLTQAHVASRIPSSTAALVRLDDDWPEIAKEDSGNLASGARATDPAYMIYTSGSTGRPKGALNAHRGIVNRLLWMQDEYQLTAADTVLQKTPFSFDVSVWEFFWPLLAGARLVVAEPGGHQDPDYLVSIIRREGVTVLHFVPPMLRAFLDAPDVASCTSLRDVMASGEALPPDLVRAFTATLPARLHNLYGPTEAAVDVTYWPCPRDPDLALVPIGRPVANTQCYILDARLEPVPVGVAGELHLGGVQVGLGYHGRPELTAEKFIPDPFSHEPGARLYKTGDLCRYLPTGDIEYLGRLDHQVKIRGFRIELGEIEAAIASFPHVKDTVVLARPGQSGAPTLVAYVASDDRQALSVRDLRSTLAERLPEYMVPAAFVVLDQFPLSPNGKIDRKRLPAPDIVPAQTSGASRPPATPHEEILAGIWQRVLRLERVGADDNFFELGGDSILALQVLSAARRAGLVLNLRQIFQHPTVAGLAAVVTAATAPQAAAGPIHGESPLTPIQRWLFERRLDDLHYFNQAFAFILHEPVDPELLTRALDAVAGHHDVLRSRFRLGDSAETARQVFAADAAPVALDRVDVSQVDDETFTTKLRALGIDAQSRLDLVHGPAWRAVLVDAGPTRPARLLLVVHHLIVDGVSWRLLVEDLETAYRALQAGRPVALPPRTSPFKAWADRLLAAPSVDQAEQSYWCDVVGTDASVPRDRADGNNTESSTEVVRVSLDTATTADLLQRAHGAYSTQINDLLLAALASALVAWTGRDDLRLDLEGHGREDLFDGLDLSRTVGWFTSMFPVRLRVTDTAAAALVPAIKEQLRAIPRRGIGYGIARYLQHDVRLAAAPAADVVFNYLGQFDAVTAGSTLLSLSRDDIGPWHAPRQHRAHAIEIDAMVIDGRFEAAWTFSRHLHDRATIERAATSFTETLTAIVEHCLRQSRRLTPSDVPLAGLDQPTLDRLLADDPAIEDIYPLSPIQSLFWTAASSGGSAVDQWTCVFDGPLDVPRFQQAWEVVCRRHPALRTSFRSAGLREPLQVVSSGPAPASWRVEDWRSRPAAAREAQWTALLQADEATGLSLERAPLMRFTLVRDTDTSHRFAWTVPAILLDGWSWPIVFRDLSHAYQALSEGHMPEGTAGARYRDYVAWMRHRPAGETEHYWRHTLAGLHAPTPVVTQSEPPTEEASGFGQLTLDLVDETAPFVALARAQQVTVGALFQTAWALVLSRLSGSDDVLFGATVAARPSELPGAGEIVGPFVNNLPMRLRLDPARTLADTAKATHGALADLAPHQFVPLAHVHQWSEFGPHHLFESLVVVQNYAVDEAARRLGAGIGIRDFVGPLHSAVPLLVLLDTTSPLRLVFKYDRRILAETTVRRWANDCRTAMALLAIQPHLRVAEALAQLSVPAAVAGRPAAKQRWRNRPDTLTPPRTDLERRIAAVWKDVLHLDEVGTDENLLELGLHSLLAVRLHERLAADLHKELSLIEIFQYPTIQRLARHLEHGEADAATATAVGSRAARQREALGRLRQAGRR